MSRFKFDPDRLNAASQYAFYAMLGRLQHHGPQPASALARFMTDVADVTDAWARQMLALAVREGYLTREPEGNSYRYDLHEDMR